LAQVKVPAGTIAALEYDNTQRMYDFESAAWYHCGYPCLVAMNMYGTAVSFHSGGINVIWGDGHVKWYRPEALVDPMWSLADK